MDRTIDYSPLFDSPTRDEVADFRRTTMAARPTAQSEQIVRIAGWVLGGVMAVVLGITVLLSALTSLIAASSGQLDPLELIGVLPPLVIIGVVAVLVARALVAQRGGWEKRLRMSRFAAANGLRFEPVSDAPSYPAAIFGVGTSRQVTDHFRTTDDRYLDFGNYRYVTGSGKNRSTHHWGFLALHLDRALPHMLLDSRANNGLLGSSTAPAPSRSATRPRTSACSPSSRRSGRRPSRRPTATSTSASASSRRTSSRRRGSGCAAGSRGRGSP